MVTAMTRDVPSSEEQAMHELAEAYSGLRARYQERYHGHLPSDIAEATDPESEVGRVYTEINREVVARQGRLLRQPRSMQQALLDWHRRLRHGRHALACTSSTNSSSNNNNNNNRSGGFRGGAVVGGSAFYGTEDLSLRVWLEGVFVYYRRRLRRHLPEQLVSSLLLLPPGVEAMGSFETVSAEGPQLARGVGDAVRCARQLGWASPGQLEDALRVLLDLMRSFDVMQQMVAIFTEGTTSTSNSNSNTSTSNGVRAAARTTSIATTTMSVCCRVLSAQLNRPGDFALLLVLFVSCILAYQDMLEAQVREYARREVTREEAAKTTMARSTAEVCEPYGTPATTTRNGPEEGGQVAQPHIRTDVERMRTLSRGLRCLYRIFGLCLSPFHHNATTILTLLLLRCTAATSRTAALCASHVSTSHSNNNTTEHSEKGNGVHAKKEAEEKDETRRSNGMSLSPAAPLTESAWRCRADVQLVTTVLPLYLHGMAQFLSCDMGVEGFVMAVLLHPLYNTDSNSNSKEEEKDHSNGDTTGSGSGGISLGVNDDSSSSNHRSKEEKSRNAEGEERHERQGSTSETPQRPAPPASQAHSHRPSLPSASASLVYYGASEHVNDDAAATVDTTCVPSRRLLTALFHRTLRPVMGQILRAAHTQSNIESNNNNYTHGTTTSTSSSGSAQAECTTARTAHGRDDEAACDMSATRQIQEAQDMLVCVAHVAVYLCVPEQPRVNWWPSVGLGPPQHEEVMMMNATEEEKRRWGGRAIGVSCFTEAMRLAVREMMQAVLAQLRISPASNGGGEADHCAAALPPLLLPRPAAAAGVEAGSTQNSKNSSTTTTTTSMGGSVSHIAAADAAARVEHACLTEAQLLAFYRTLLACGPAFYAVSEQAAELCGAYERTRRSAAEEDEATTRDTRTKPQTDLMAFLWESDTNARRAQNLLQDCASLFTSEGPALLLAMSPGESATTLATLLVNSLHHYILVHSDAELAELAASEKERTKKEGEEHHDSGGGGRAAAGAASLPSLPHTRSQYTNTTTTASTSTRAGVPSRAAIVPLRDEDALRAALRFLACLPSPRSFYTPYTDLCRRRLLSPAWGPRLSERAVRQCRQRWERHVHSALVALYGPSPELQLLHHLIADLDVDDAQPGEDIKGGGGVRQEGSDATCRGSAHASQPPPPSSPLPPSLQTQQQQEEAGEQGVAAQNRRNEDDEQKAAMALRVYVLNYRWWGYRKEAHLPDSALLAANTRREREAQRGEGQGVPRAFIPSEHTDMVLWPSSSSSSTTTAAAVAVVKMNESTHAAGQTTTKTATTTTTGPSLSSSAGTSEACGDTMIDPLPFPRDLQAKLREYGAQYAQHHTRTRLCWRQAAECYTTFTLTLRRRRRGGGQCHRTAQDAACKKQSKEEEGEEEDAAAGGRGGDDVLVQITMHGTLLLQQLYLAIAQYGRRGVSYRTLAARAGGMSVAGLAQLLRRHSEKFRLLVQLPPSLPSLSSSLLAAAHTDSSSEAYMNNNNNRKAVTSTDGGGSDVGAQRVALNVDYLLQLQQEQQEEDKEGGGGEAAGGVREFTHLPPRVLCLPLLSLGQSEERERLRQHRLQIALVQLLKRAQTMSADALFAAVRERLAESALSRVAFKRGVETLIEGGLVERVNADAVVAAYRYVA